MVNLLEFLYVVTAAALLASGYYAVAGQRSAREHRRFRAALWASAGGIVVCAVLYWYLLPR